MFAGPSAGGLVAGPTAGAINTNPASYIPDDGLAIAQVAELRGELTMKHPLITAAASLSQNLVSNLPSDLAMRATVEQLTTGLAQKHPLLTATSTLPQALVTNLTSDLALRATAQQLTDSIATRQPVIQDGSLTIARTSGLQAALDEKARASDVSTALAGRQAAAHPRRFSDHCAHVWSAGCAR